MILSIEYHESVLLLEPASHYSRQSIHIDQKSDELLLEDKLSGQLRFRILIVSKIFQLQSDHYLKFSVLD